MLRQAAADIHEVDTSRSEPLVITQDTACFSPTLLQCDVNQSADGKVRRYASSPQWILDSRPKHNTLLLGQAREIRFQFANRQQLSAPQGRLPSPLFDQICAKMPLFTITQVSKLFSTIVFSQKQLIDCLCLDRTTQNRMLNARWQPAPS